jgi:ApaG protein
VLPCRSYRITITNESQDTVKLMERYWHITNGQGQVQEVRGPGVIGEQPELKPGETFQYQSACPLPTPKGTMRGHYEFYAQVGHGTGCLSMSALPVAWGSAATP